MKCQFDKRCGPAKQFKLFSKKGWIEDFVMVCKNHIINAVAIQLEMMTKPHTAVPSFFYEQTKTLLDVEEKHNSTQERIEIPSTTDHKCPRPIPKNNSYNDYFKPTSHDHSGDWEI